MRQRTYGGVGSPAREGGLTQFNIGLRVLYILVLKVTNATKYHRYSMLITSIN